MKDNKVPGVDGLSKEFYIVFWDIIGCHLLEVFRGIFGLEHMGVLMCEGVISLLYKKGDPKTLANWRPLTMLCVDYKLLSKAVTNRLSSAMAYVVGLDQTCGVVGRRLTWNLQLHRDVQAYLEERHLPAITVNLDQEKAFDMVSHEFLFRIMEKFGFGNNFMKWVKILYSNVGSRVNINGNIGNVIKQLRGVRQGDPLSALLYVLYIEPFACAIRTNYNIKGIILPGGDMLKISQYADDTVLYLQDDLSLKESIKIIDEFSVASGSKINKNKTEIKYLGQWKWRTDQLCGLTVCTGPMVVLGISFGNEIKDDMFNWKEKLLSINKRLGLWKVRRLSFSGKVLVLKADILPSLLHLAYVFPMPVSLRKTFIRVLFNFFWGGYEYIRRDRMYQPIEAGGRDFPHIPLKLDALFYSNICCLLSSSVHKCHILIKFWLSVPLRFMVKWDNSKPKAEIIPLHFKKIVEWARKTPVCKVKENVINHRLLYAKLIENCRPRDRLPISPSTWIRTQLKGLDNRLKDFNWLVLHRRLPVRSTLYDHNLTLNKFCPRHNCFAIETIPHVLWECSFAQSVWGKSQQFFEILKNIDYEGVAKLEIKNVERVQLLALVTLVSLIKTKLWEARCGAVNDTLKWSPTGLVQFIKQEVWKRIQFEIDKGGIASVKQRWKGIYPSL